MASFDGTTAMKFQYKPITFLALLLVVTVGWQGYRGSLQVTDAKIIAMVDDPGLRGGKILRVSVASVFPAWPIIPDALRQFFPLRPKLCIQNKDGSELVNDDAWTSRFEANNEGKGPHAAARREFAIPFLLQPSAFNGERRFFKSLQQNHGMWATFRLEGFFLPPSVDSAPFFLDLAPVCQANPAACRQVFGWEK
jgi:hypothetical protein